MAKKGEKRTKLTAKEAVFVKEYLKDLNGSQAILRTGYKTKYPDKMAHQMLGKARVSHAIQIEKDKRAERTDLSIDRVLLEYKRLALFDPRKLYDADGNLIPISKWDDDTAAAVSMIDTEELFAGRGEERVKIGEAKHIKPFDKCKALSDVMKHLGGFEKDNAQRNDVAAAAAAALAAVKGAKTGEEKIRAMKNILK